MAGYRVEYEERARKTLEMLSAPRREQIRGAISVWAQNPPPSGNHTKHRIEVPSGNAFARVEHRTESVHVIVIMAVEC